MREIKFRAWDRKEKKWIEFGPRFGLIAHTLKKVDHFGDDFEIVQFTGLKDKNGEHEIYEGDRIKTPAGVGVVEWRGGCFRICWNDTDATTLHDTPQDMMEVIGNIYENPELLK